MTEDMLRDLMSSYNISTEFLEVVSSFYQKHLNIEEALTLPFQRVESEYCLGRVASCSQPHILANASRIHVHSEIPGADESSHR